MQTPTPMRGDHALIRQLLSGHCTQFLLRANAQHPSAMVRSLVASRKEASRHLLARMASDDDEVVRSCVAANPNTPPRILRQLENDPNQWVRAAAKRQIYPEFKSVFAEALHMA